MKTAKDLTEIDEIVHMFVETMLEKMNENLKNCSKNEPKAPKLAVKSETESGTEFLVLPEKKLKIRIIKMKTSESSIQLVLNQKKTSIRSPDSSEVKPQANLEPNEKKRKVSENVSSSQKIAPKPFVASPLSQNENFRSLHAAYYRTFNLKEIQKINESFSTSLFPFATRKPFFPNFIDPVPPNHKFAFERQNDNQGPSSSLVTNVVAQKDSVTSSSSNNSETAAIEKVFDSNEIMTKMITYFDNLCPKVIFDELGCNEVDCFHTLHEIPKANVLRRQLLKHSLQDSKDVFNLVLTFPFVLRVRFFPAFVEVGAKRRHGNFLKRVICEGFKSKIIVNLSNVLKSMESYGWTNQEAIKFLIKNHDGSKAMINAIVEVITSSGSETTKSTLADLLSKSNN